MAAYRRVYDSRHLQADCQLAGSAPELYAWQSSMGYLSTLFTYDAMQTLCRWITAVKTNCRPISGHDWRHAVLAMQTLFVIFTV